MNRYYVIINGINSLTIPGLAIRELPPISKTLMRNQREEIDGRDGDITTELGYSAYDKTMTIGLYGNYDINQIIAFFNQKGTIVFSDEADKYYNFTILERIDYAKLVKFRTASVKFHCQPFKYELNETPQTITTELVESTGEEATLNDTAETSLQVGLKGNTYQETAPNPDYPQEVQVVTGDNTIIVGNKNLLKLGTGSSSRNNTELTITEDVLNFKNTGTTNYVAYGIDGTLRNANYGDRITWNNKVLKAGTYTLSYKYLSGSNNSTQAGGNFVRVYVYGRNIGDTNYPTELANCNISATSTSSTFTISEDKEVIVVAYLYGNISVDINFKVMLESGETASTYVPYQEQNYTIDLGDLELCKIGTYQDYLYKSGGNWYKHTEIGKITLDGTEDITQNSNTSYSNTMLRFTISVADKKLSASNTEADNIKCNMFTSRALNFDARTQESITGHDSNHTIIIFIDSSRLSSADITGFKAWLSSNTPVVYYVLETPTEEQITDEVLITQLELLQNAMSYLDQTNVTQTYDNMPFILDLKAIKKGTNEITINNAGNIYSKPIMALNGSGMIEININDTEVLRVDMSEHHNIVIDSANMEAYNPNTMVLRNRQVTGNYENLKLNQGENKIKVLGQLTEATITDYTRWL